MTENERRERWRDKLEQWEIARHIQRERERERDLVRVSEIFRSDKDQITSNSKLNRSRALFLFVLSTWWMLAVVGAGGRLVALASSSPLEEGLKGRTMALFWHVGVLARSSGHGGLVEHPFGNQIKTRHHCCFHRWLDKTLGHWQFADRVCLKPFLCPQHELNLT